MKMPLPQDIGSLSSEIDKCTQVGNEELDRGEQEKALQAFAAAYEKSVLLEEKYTERACAFNLGAVYIAMGQPQRGLELLQRALPQDDEQEEQSNSDLYYNLGLGYDQLQRYNEAIRYYEQAIEAYRKDGENPLMEGEALTKLAFTYTNLNKSSQAAKCHGQAAVLYERADDVERQALALNFQATCLLESRRVPECEEALDRCRDVCGKMEEGEVLGKLYNDLGMTYTSAKAFSKAVECFELALPLTRGPQGDKKREAVLLQNLGAVYNSCGEYQRAISFHESAAKLHNDLGNRQAQGHCFCNLAYAFSQINDNDAAGEAFLHALQAAKDTGDKHGQWQAHEGLGAVHFRQGNPEKAIANYKQALALLTRLKDPNSQAQERIVGKLTDALKYQLKIGDSPRHPGKDRKLISSLEKRPLSPQTKNGSVAHHIDESITSESPRSDPGRDRQHPRTAAGKRRPRRYVKRERSFSDSTQGSMHNLQTVAHGIDEYDPNADLALFDAKKKKTGQGRTNNGLHPSSASTITSATVEHEPVKASLSDPQRTSTASDEPDLAYSPGNRNKYHTYPKSKDTSYSEEGEYVDVIPTRRAKAAEDQAGSPQDGRRGSQLDAPALKVNGETSQQSSSETSALSSSESGSSESGESDSETEGKEAVRKEYRKALQQNGMEATAQGTPDKASMPPPIPPPLVDSPMSTSALNNTYMTPADISRETPGDGLPLYAVSSKHKTAQQPTDGTSKGQQAQETSGTDTSADSSSSEESASETESDPDEHVYETLPTRRGDTVQLEGKPGGDDQPKARVSSGMRTPPRETPPPQPQTPTLNTMTRADREEALFQLAKQQSKQQQDQAERDMAASRSQSRNESKTCVVM